MILLWCLWLGLWIELIIFVTLPPSWCKQHVLPRYSIFHTTRGNSVFMVIPHSCNLNPLESKQFWEKWMFGLKRGHSKTWNEMLSHKPWIIMLVPTQVSNLRPAYDLLACWWESPGPFFNWGNTSCLNKRLIVAANGIKIMLRICTVIRPVTVHHNSWESMTMDDVGDGDTKLSMSTLKYNTFTAVQSDVSFPIAIISVVWSIV